MNIKITGPGGVQETQKSKKTKRSGKTDGPSFADLLDSATTVDAPEETAEVRSLTALGAQSSYVLTEEVPQDPQQHGAYLLQQLEELERDILSGSPTEAVQRLKQALEQSPLKDATLNERQQKILDALHLRASVEIAKIEND
jgi:hypothetical protein